MRQLESLYLQLLEESILKECLQNDVRTKKLTFNFKIVQLR